MLSSLIEVTGAYKKACIITPRSNKYIFRSHSMQRQMDIINVVVDPNKFISTNCKMIGPREQKAGGKELFEQKMILSMELNVLPKEELVESFLQGQVRFHCLVLTYSSAFSKCPLAFENL